MPALTTKPSSVQTLLEDAAEFLKTAKSPQGPFDPSGPWQQTFAIWAEYPKKRMGWLTLQKQPPKDDAFNLLVDWRLNQLTKDCQHVRATVNCADQ